MPRPSSPMTDLASTMQRLWTRLAPRPGGAWLFSLVMGRVVPYTGALGARVLVLEPGFCQVTLADRRGVRNHLHSIHAVALVNLGEMTSGLAMTMALPPGVRGIVTSIGADYLRKARGLLTAEARVSVPEVGAEPVDTRVETIIRNEAGEVVSRVHTIWRLQRA